MINLSMNAWNDLIDKDEVKPLPDLDKQHPQGFLMFGQLFNGHARISGKVVIATGWCPPFDKPYVTIREVDYGSCKVEEAKNEKS